MNQYSRVVLKTSAAGPPGPLPPEIENFSDETLADLSAALKPTPSEFKGIGYWPVTFLDPGVDQTKNVVLDAYDIKADVDQKIVTAKAKARAMTAAEQKAAYEASNPVQQEVEKVFFLRALRQLRLKEAFDEAVAQAGEETQEDWEASSFARRRDPVIEKVSIMMQKDDAAIDELFRVAGILKRGG